MDNCPYNYNSESLHSLHTKQLLQILNNMRSCCIDGCLCVYSTSKNNNYDNCMENNHRDNIIILLKKELSTRPHIKNKQESKKYRKALIKKGK